MTLSVSACDSNELTELEGSWASQCSPFGNIPNATVQYIYTFHGSNMSAYVDVYDDSTCTHLSYTTPLSEYYFIVDPTEVPASFSIGDFVSSINGVMVREIDITSVGNEVFPNIYLLQDNSNTLYIGLSCENVESSCITNRPNEINYNQSLIRI